MQQLVWYVGRGRRGWRGWNQHDTRHTKSETKRISNRVHYVDKIREDALNELVKGNIKERNEKKESLK